ncbi:hypothetical protein [Lysobacter capsici]|uniref:hypothetical protein n=1 Tax=Lysobacter capsici TaxID=435897 RepID=UPI001BFFF758|nr:hypothetical protein [Lysobacter capsici]QWF18657.1 hypothetical protein KME82_07900 [Lysobacter capsici]
MTTAWLRTTASIALAAAGFGFVATLQASQPCDCEAMFKQCLLENELNYPGQQLDCDVMYRLCMRGHCQTP